MKLYTFAVKTQFGVAARTGVRNKKDQLVDINLVVARLLKDRGHDNFRDLSEVMGSTSMLELIRNWRWSEELISDALNKGISEGPDGDSAIFEFGQVKLCAPLPRPWRIHDFMVGLKHVSTSFGGKTPENWSKFPVCYKGNPDAIFGPDDVIKKPRYTSKLDYELELGMIIGKKGKDISKENASKYIFGYTIFNDFSARDIQFEEMKVGLGPFKGKDFATAIGPCIATSDEIEPTKIKMTASVNGALWSSGYLDDMQFSFPEIIEHLSNEEYVFPGDLIGSGTVGGGCGLELGKNIDVGDTVILEAEGIGSLRNFIQK